jgi:hypothetical protein
MPESYGRPEGDIGPFTAIRPARRDTKTPWEPNIGAKYAIYFRSCCRSGTSRPHDSTYD